MDTSSTDKLCCDGLLEGIVGAMSTYPSMDLARYFMYDFFTHYNERPEGVEAIEVYKS